MPSLLNLPPTLGLKGRRRVEITSILGTPDCNLRETGTEKKSKKKKKKDPQVVKTFNYHRLDKGRISERNPLFILGLCKRLGLCPKKTQE